MQIFLVVGAWILSLCAVASSVMLGIIAFGAAGPTKIWLALAALTAVVFAVLANPLTSGALKLRGQWGKVLAGQGVLVAAGIAFLWLALTNWTSHVSADASNVTDSTATAIDVDPEALRRVEQLASYEVECAGGDGGSCRSLGSAFEFGRGVEVDQERAVAYYFRACNIANETSVAHEDCYPLAVARRDGNGIAQDEDSARNIMAFACSGVGELAAMACMDLAAMRQSGRGGPVDNAGAISAVREAIAADPESEAAERARDLLRRSEISVDP